jgi:hypothetical protein
MVASRPVSVNRECGLVFFDVEWFGVPIAGQPCGPRGGHGTAGEDRLGAAAERTVPWWNPPASLSLIPPRRTAIGVTHLLTSVSSAVFQLKDGTSFHSAQSPML